MIQSARYKRALFNQYPKSRKKKKECCCWTLAKKKKRKSASSSECNRLYFELSCHRYLNNFARLLCLYDPIALIGCKYANVK